MKDKSTKDKNIKVNVNDVKLKGNWEMWFLLRNLWFELQEAVERESEHCKDCDALFEWESRDDHADDDEYPCFNCSLCRYNGADEDTKQLIAFAKKASDEFNGKYYEPEDDKDEDLEEDDDSLEEYEPCEDDAAKGISTEDLNRLMAKCNLIFPARS